MASFGQVVSSHSLRCGQSSFFTQASIDSRRSSCSSVKRRCLRVPSCWGLMTVAASTLAPWVVVVGFIAICPTNPTIARSSAWGLSSIEYYFILCATVAGVGEELVLYEVSGGVATVTLNDPDKRNRLSQEMLTQLVDAIK